MPDTWTLYRLYDGRKALLYIGITKRGWVRTEDHAKTKKWWREVESATFRHYRTREAAHSAEKAAIKAERPKYNTHHTGATAPPQTPDKPQRWQPHSGQSVTPPGFPDPATTPTLPIWPDAGKLLGYSNRSAAYRAADAGYLPTVRLSERRWVAPTAAVLSMLGIAVETND